MDQGKRPVRREKNVTGATGHVGRRTDQSYGPHGRRTGAGPVGSGQSGGSGRAGGPAFGGGSQHQSGRGPTRGGRNTTLIVFIVIVVIAALVGGGGGLSGLFGGLGGLLGGGGGSSGGGYSNGLGGSQSAPAPAVTPGVTQDAGELDTTVSRQARDKYTVLRGGGKDVTTILVYMCGTDLESGGGYATKDLQEMINARLNKNVNLLVFTGGCKSWRNSQVSSSKNQTWQVRDGGIALVDESSSLKPMTDPATLSGFIQWGAKNYPADRYELIFWDHGGGSVSGYGYDEVYPKSGSMALDGIAKALKNGGVTFDFIGFDACLMATLETALVAEPWADYLIASEETEPGCGWYYTDWLTALAASPSMPALEIGKNIADSFVRGCASAAPRQQATLSVIDLAELSGTVPQAFRDFSQATAESIRADDYQSIAAARGNAKEFGARSKLDQIDLIHLADNMNTAESRALAKVLRSAVKYNATSSNIENAYGVSIYFPYTRTSNVKKATQLYDEIGLDSAYTDCIKSFASLEVAGQTVSGGSSAQMSSLFGTLTGANTGSGSAGSVGADMISQLLGSLLSGSGRSLAEVGLTADEAEFLDASLLERSTGYLAAHQFDPAGLSWTSKNGQKVISLPQDQWDLVQTVELNVFVDDGEGYIDLGLDNVYDLTADGDLLCGYDRTWMGVNGQFVAYYLMSVEGTQEDYKILGRIPALLNGQRVELIACFTDENPNGEILGAAPVYDEAEETATLARGLLDIVEGDVIDFLCRFYDYDRNYLDDYPLGEPLKVTGPLTLSDIRMDNSRYIAAFRFTDIYNNHYWTPAIG